MDTTKQRLRKERGEKRLRKIFRMLMIVFVLCGCYFGYQALRNPALSFGDIVVEGDTRFSRKDVLKILNYEEPINLFNISRSNVINRLSGDVNISDVSVSYGLPAIMYINITDRKPVLYIRNSYQSFVTVDKNAMVLDVSQGLKGTTIPILTGISCGNVFIGDHVQNIKIRNVIDFINSLNDEALSKISEIYINNSGNIRVELAYGFPVLLGNVDQIKEKSEIFMTVFNEIKDRNVQADFIDIQYAKPFIKLK